MEKDMSFFVPTDFAWIMEILSKHMVSTNLPIL